MQRQSLTLIAAVLGLVVVCLGGSLAQVPPPKPLPEELVKEWKKAGAAVGGMIVKQNGRVEFTPEKDGKFPGIPAFQFLAWQNGVFANLPDPESSFGLSFLSVRGQDLDVKEVARFKNLQGLLLLHLRATDASLKELAPLTNLQWLDCTFNKKITDAGLKQLGSLKHLQNLNLSHSEVTGTGFAELAGLEKLETVSLWNAKVNDGGMKGIAKLKSLRRLDLGFCKLSDVGLMELASCQNLRHLDTIDSKVTAGGLRELSKKLPKLFKDD